MTTTRKPKKAAANANSISNGYIQPVRLQAELLEQLDVLAEHFTTSRGAVMRYTMQLGIRVLSDLNGQIDKSVSSTSNQLRNAPMPYLPSRLTSARVAPSAISTISRSKAATKTKPSSKRSKN